MKRSEMVQLIWLAINELEDGDHILKRIEDAGMLPPLPIPKNNTYEEWCDAKEFGNRWEPEDE